jgi:hypothetical protein
MKDVRGARVEKSREDSDGGQFSAVSISGM